MDLPGTYSLLSASQDEEVARNFILFGQPDCTIVVTDATALERNLNLALQVMEITDKVVIAVNLMDEARRKAWRLIPAAWHETWVCRAIPIVARSGEGMQMLLQTVADVIEGTISTAPFRVQGSSQYQTAVDQLAEQIQQLYPPFRTPAGWRSACWMEMTVYNKLILNGELADLVSGQQRSDVQFSKQMAVSGRQ